MVFLFPQEKRRILEKFPDSHKLKDDDEKHLQDTLRKAKEKQRPEHQSGNLYADFGHKKSD